jgi:hypothetical protein
MNAPTTGNPNAEVAVYTGAGTIVLVWCVSLLGVDVPAEVAAAVTTVATGLVLFIGKRVGARNSR